MSEHTPGLSCLERRSASMSQVVNQLHQDLQESHRQLSTLTSDDTGAKNDYIWERRRASVGAPLILRLKDKNLTSGGNVTLSGPWRSQERQSPAMDPPQNKAGRDSDDEGTGRSAPQFRMTHSCIQTPRAEGAQPQVHPGNWSTDNALWHSGPSTFGNHLEHETTVNTAPSLPTCGNSPLGSKMELVYSLLSMLGTQDCDEMSRRLLAMSSSPDSCITMRQTGCIPLLIQLLHGSQSSDCPVGLMGNRAGRDVRGRASQALHNIVHSHPDDKRGRREARVLRLLEQIREYSDYLQDKIAVMGKGPLLNDDMEKHPGPAIAALMKLSFDEEHRHAMCQLGGLHAIAELIQVDHEAHGSMTIDQSCVTLRRYAGMALTNLTFGDGTNKALLCSCRGFLRSLTNQLSSPNEDLRQVTASVLRNLSWRADPNSKQALRESGTVTQLVQAAIEASKESTLKSILSALWNLSAHCSRNKAEICEVDGALAFLVGMLSYRSQSNTLAIVENTGGILRNVSSHIALKEDYRAILRENNCLQILLGHLRSPSLTVVSNACGTLWNLSARCRTDQAALWTLGAPAMLRSLTHSKHKMIAMGSAAALKNLLAARGATPGALLGDSRTNGGVPTLQARKARMMEQELDPNLSETCDNIDSNSPRSSPTNLISRRSMYPSAPPSVYSRSDSHDSIASTHSDPAFDRVRVYTSIDPSERYFNRISVLTRQVVNGESKPLDLTTKVTQECDSADEGSQKSDKELRHIFSELSSRSSESSDAESKSDSRNAKVMNGVMSPSRVPRPETAPPRYNSTTAWDTGEHPPQRSSSDHSMAQTLTEKIHSLTYNEDQDEAIDFSRKYNEKRPPATTVKTDTKVYSPYMENDDPDELTNYSLLYSEDTYEDGKMVHEDQVKTYCTEGTPYETPLNFSSAASMTDLHEICEKDTKAQVVDEKVDASLKKNVAPPTVHSQLSSGIMTPEKPVMYCEEGTPVCFSRMSSLSSLNSGDGGESKGKPSPQKRDPEHRQGKTVRWGVCASVVEPEETPLMFSRSSSPSSLSSCEQHSIRSSVISDFSRRTSEVVSPSDLPDSPGGTMPPSPRIPTAPADFARNVSKPSPGVSVFVEAPRVFQEEGTPAHFSDNTSLSSLTLDPKSDVKENDKPACKEVIHEDAVKEELEDSLSGDEDMLAACISIAMPDKNKSVGPKRSSGIPVKIKPQEGLLPSRIPRPAPQHTPNEAWVEDSVRTFCVEGTPADMSNAGSYSDLSVLSIPGESQNTTTFNTPHRPRRQPVSDDSSLSDDKDNILAMCIQSAMPKARSAPKPRPVPKTGHLCSNHAPAAQPPSKSTKHKPRPLQSRIKKLQNKEAQQEKALAEQPTTYHVEDTPLNFSNATSLSDITVESLDTTSQRAPVAVDSPRVYAVEGTPLAFSRHDSLSSLSLPEDEEQDLSRRTVIKGQSGESTPGKMAKRPPKESVSRNSSMSSLSAGEGVGASEEALLEQCINDALPQAKVPPKPCRKEPKSGKKELKLVPGLAIPKLELKIRKRPSVEDMMTKVEGEIDASNEAKVIRDVGERHRKSLDETTPDSKESSSPSESQVVVRALEASNSSMSSELLDAVKPPSGMSSMMSSMTSSQDNSDAKNGLNSLTRKLKKGVPEMVRRALGSHELMRCSGGSEMLDGIRPPSAMADVEPHSMTSSCTSNLDHVKPPSLLEEAELDSSIISVASITSEVADLNRSTSENNQSDAMFDIIKPLATVTQMYLEDCAKEGSSEPVLDLVDVTDHDSTIEQGTYTLGSDDEVAELPKDDTPTPRSTPTPQNSGTSSQESTPKAKKRLTPKQRRLTSKERYKTYTLPAESECPKEEEESEQSPRTKGVKERRAEEKDRFKTQIISRIPEDSRRWHLADEDDLKSAYVEDCRRSNASLVKQRREEARERFRTHTICEGDLVSPKRESTTQDRHSFAGVESRHKYPMQNQLAELDLSLFPGSNEGLGVDLELPPDDILKHGANLVISSLNNRKQNDQCAENLIDVETVSLVSNESESETGKIDNDVFTDDAQNNNVMSGGDDSDTDSSPQEVNKVKGARIVKPGESPKKESEDEERKGIRGKRKALYSTPKNSSSTNSTPTKTVQQSPRTTSRSSSPSIKKGPTVSPAKTSPLAVRPTRASSLRQTTSHTQRSVTPQSTPSSSPRHPRRPPQVPAKPAPLVRQNTFNKDEQVKKEKGTNNKPKTSISQTETKKKTPPKVPPKPKLRKDGVQPVLHDPVRKGPAKAMKQSPSSHSLQGTACTSGPGVEKAKQTADLCVGRRAGSSTSLSSTSSASTGRTVLPAPTAPQPPKEVTSKIAFLWRKVEESRSKAIKDKGKDSRVWITSENPDCTPQQQLDQNRNAKPTGGKSRSRLSLRLSRFTDKTRPKETKCKGVSTPTPESPGGGGWGEGTYSPKRQQDEDMDDGVAFKRVSRLGSFMRFEGEKDGKQREEKTPIRSPQSAIVPPFNYIPSGRGSSGGASPCQGPSVGGRTFSKGVHPQGTAGVRRSNSYLSSMEGNQSQGGRGRGRGSVMITTV